ncbi:hypothetical protein BY458DRAFT_496977 [Sporodiniella umbellata]|nr:hypothetical protein BY458DRAFT_496977 [Sporodiniella umbellata]
MDSMSKEQLMKRLVDASQLKIYPPVTSRYEVPLRKILLTTRLWNHVRKEQDLLVEDTWLDEFMFSQEDLKKKDLTDWSWIEQEELLLETIDDTLNLLSHEKRKREEDGQVQKKFKIDQDIFCFSSDTAGPATPTSPVLLSA